MNKKTFILLGGWCLLLGAFFVTLSYYPIRLYYDGYLTVFKNNMDELNYIFVPHQESSILKVDQQVTIRYIIKQQWHAMTTQVKWENDYYVMFQQPEFMINVWYLSAKMEFGEQTTLDYLLKIML